MVDSYRVWAKGIDGMCPPGRREMHSPYGIGDAVWAKPPNCRCTSNFKKGFVINYHQWALLFVHFWGEDHPKVIHTKKLFQTVWRYPKMLKIRIPLIPTATHNTHRDPHSYIHIYIYIYIYIYIVIHRQTVSFYQNSSVWLDTQDARSRDRNPSNFS